MCSSVDRHNELDRIGYDPATGTYRTQYDWEDPSSPYLTIVETVSAVNGQEPTSIEPLYSVLDPEALESLLYTGRDSNVQITFTFEECTVSVTGHGEVVIKPENEP